MVDRDVTDYSDSRKTLGGLDVPVVATKNWAEELGYNQHFKVYLVRNPIHRGYMKKCIEARFGQ